MNTRSSDPANRFSELIDELGRPGTDPVSLIRKGLNVALLADAATLLGVPLARIRTLAGVSPHTAQALASRKGNLDPAASERIWRMADVAGLARRAFNSDEAAAAWLRMPHPVFGHAAPIDWLDTEPGAASVRKVLDAIAQNSTSS